VTTPSDVQRFVVTKVQEAWPDFFDGIERPSEPIEVVSYVAPAAGDLERTIEWMTECIAIETAAWNHVVGVDVAHGHMHGRLIRHTGIWGVVNEVPPSQRLATLTVDREDGLWLGGVAGLGTPREAATFLTRYWGVGRALVFLDDVSDAEDILRAQADSEVSHMGEYPTRLFLPELVSREVPRGRRVARYWDDHEVSLDVFGLAGARISRAFGAERGEGGGLVK
jgi:hypothetical protein